MYLDEKELDMKKRICDYAVENDALFICWFIFVGWYVGKPNLPVQTLVDVSVSFMMAGMNPKSMTVDSECVIQSIIDAYCVVFCALFSLPDFSSYSMRFKDARFGLQQYEALQFYQIMQL